MHNILIILCVVSRTESVECVPQPCVTADDADVQRSRRHPQTGSSVMSFGRKKRSCWSVYEEEQVDIHTLLVNSLD